MYKVKCLNHTQYEPNESGTGKYRELAPGHVTLVTIPNQNFHKLRNPLKPYTSLGLLREIHDFVQKHTSCFVKLHIKNPQFEEVKTDFKVKFQEGSDESFYLKKLKHELTRFLSPWAYSDGAKPTFGGKIYKSVLINFVEERPYVDFVTDFKLYHFYPGHTLTEDFNEIEGSLAVSILVSIAEKKHNIEIVPLSNLTIRGEKCGCSS